MARDVRKDEPYAVYDEMQFDIPIGAAGDTYDRYLVRLEEFRQSMRIIRRASKACPKGPIVGKVPRLIKPPAGETYHAIESPKGEIGFFIVSDGKSTSPYRLRVRPPSFCNLQALPQLVARPPGGRRHRDHRHHRHRARRGGSVGELHD